MIYMEKFITNFTVDTAAGLQGITAEYRAGICKTIFFDDVPSFCLCS